jgi:hypothetical protein
MDEKGILLYISILNKWNGDRPILKITPKINIIDIK